MIRSPWIGPGMVVVIAFAACAVRDAALELPRAAHGEPWSATELEMTLRHVANATPCDGRCCTVEDHWVTELRASRSQDESPVSFPDAQLAACKERLRVSANQGAAVAPHDASRSREVTIAIRAPANAALAVIARRISLCCSVGLRIVFCVDGMVTDERPRHLLLPLPWDARGSRVPMPLVALVEIEEPTAVGDHEFVLEEWSDNMFPDVDPDFRVPRGPRTRVYGRDALCEMLPEWRREHAAGGRREEGWIAGTDRTPLQAVIDVLDALRAAGFEQICLETLEQSARRR